MPYYGNLTDNIPLDGAQYFGLLSLNFLELAIHLLLTFPFSILNFFLILRTSILHPNLKFILLSQSASIFARSFIRIVIVFIKLHKNNLTWKQTRLQIFLFTYCAYFRNFLPHILIIERVRATIHFRNYEWSGKPYFTVTWLILVNALSLANVYGTSETSSTTFLNIMVWAILLFLATIELAIIIWLRNRNDRIYISTQYIVTASLSERYQLAENIRTAKQLIPVLLIHFFNILIDTVAYWAGYFQIFGPLITAQSKFHYELLNQIHTSIVAVDNFLIELMMILFHPYLRRNFVEICAKIRCVIDKILSPLPSNRIAPMSITNDLKDRTMSLTSIRGEEMLRGNDETEQYFRHLRMVWESKGPPPPPMMKKAKKKNWPWKC